MNEKIALITTTINVPEVLALYRQCDQEVRFFVAGDQKTSKGVAEFVEALGNARYIAPDEQHRWNCSEPVGWNCIQRRNIAMLEALEWGADIIVSVDDDNIPMDRNYFADIRRLMGGRFSGLSAVGFNYWFDIGQLLQPVAKHRGFSHDVKALWSIKPAVDARVGVCAGLCLGDPDIDAVTRMALAPEVHSMSELARRGLIVDKTTWTVFNSQNTAIRRQFAPYFFMFPGVGRYDDIYASLIVQWAMWAFDYHVHFGDPAIWQQRNPHNLMKDLRAEIEGMEKVKHIPRLLAGVSSFDGLKSLEEVFALLAVNGILPKATFQACEAWIRDIEEVL